MMRKRWLALSVLTVLAVAPVYVAACSCTPHSADPNEIEARLGSADVVLIGTSVGDRLISTERCSGSGRCWLDERRVHSVTVDTAIAGVEAEASVEIEAQLTVRHAALGSWLECPI